MVRTMLLVVVFLSCGGPPVIIKASDYDQTCVVAADCIIVQEGDYCADAITHCTCLSASISVAAKTKFYGDVAAIRCAPNPPPPRYSCGVCSTREAVCTQGKCTAEFKR